MSLLDGLISYIRFNRIDGNTIPAEIGTDGVATDVVIEDSSAKFNGSTSVVIVNEPLVATQKVLTVACWAKYDSSKINDGKNAQVLVQLDLPFRNFYVGTKGNLYPPEDFEKIEFVNQTSDYNWIVAKSNSPMLNEWVHVAFTIDKNKAKCYINGNFLEEISIVYMPEYDIIHFGNNKELKYPLNGNIKEFRFYDRVLAEDEITELYNYIPYTKPKNQILTISQIVLPENPLNKNQVLTISQIVRESVDLTKNRLLTIEQRVVASFNKQLLTIEQTVENRQQIKLNIEQNVVRQVNKQLLTIEQIVVKSQPVIPVPPPTPIPPYIKPYNPYKFSGGKGKTFGFGDFNLYVYIDKRQVDACELIDTITISRGERESALCEILLLQNRGKVDFYAFHGKDIRIDVVHSEGVIRCYTGLIDEPTFRPFDRRAILKCSDLRLKRNENLEQSEIDKIGFYSKEVFKDINDDKAAELERRLESIPFSFEYDASGKPHLTSWKPKEIPDFIIDDCSIYKREPILTISPMGRVVNKIKLKFNNNYTRLLQRDLPYRFDSHPFGVCDYLVNKFIMCPKVADIETATRQSGWIAGEMRSDPLPKTGWYYCNGTKTHWSTTSVKVGSSKVEKDKHGNVIKDKDDKEIYKPTSVTTKDYSKTYAPKANWVASKRWSQNISEQFELTIESKASIKRYDVQETEIVYQINHEFDDKNDFLNYQVYEKPRDFKKSGDYYKDYGDVNKSYQETWDYALNVAKTKIFASHRQNSITLEMPFAPQFDLKHTLGLVSKNFKGKAKISRIVHKIDVVKKHAETTVTCKFYQGFGGDAEEVERPNRPYVNTMGNLFGTKTLRTNVLKGEPNPKKDNEIEGYVLREVIINESKPKAGQVESNPLNAPKVMKKAIPIHFLVKVPEIEKKSTDALIAKVEKSADISIPHDEVELYI